MNKVFKKIQKTYFGAILGPFCPNLGKNEFPWTKGSSVFKHSNYERSCQKSEKTYEPSLRKIPTWWMQRHTGNDDFIGPSIGPGQITLKRVLVSMKINDRKPLSHLWEIPDSPIFFKKFHLPIFYAIIQKAKLCMEYILKRPHHA